MSPLWRDGGAGARPGGDDKLPVTGARAALVAVAAGLLLLAGSGWLWRHADADCDSPPNPPYVVGI